MNSHFISVKKLLLNRQYTWVITGVAGFIGSHLLEFLLKHNQKVVGIDNYFSGYEDNLAQVKEIVSEEQWQLFEFHEESVCDFDVCKKLTHKADYVLHQAALCSVPRSLEDPMLTYAINAEGSLNVFESCRMNRVKRVVYASSSAVYGDDPTTAKKEDVLGCRLSPYAVSKYMSEEYATSYHQMYDVDAIGLRYFNVFGARQDPDGAYAAVIPKWLQAMLQDQPVIIYGDGESTRDYCHVDNVVQANILAAMTDLAEMPHRVYNVACGLRTTLKQLHEALRKILLPEKPELRKAKPVFEDFRKGDIKHSLADITRIQTELKYDSTILLNEGLKRSVEWYKKNV